MIQTRLGKPHLPEIERPSSYDSRSTARETHVVVVFAVFAAGGKEGRVALQLSTTPEEQAKDDGEEGEAADNTAGDGTGVGRVGGVVGFAERREEVSEETGRESNAEQDKPASRLPRCEICLHDTILTVGRRSFTIRNGKSAAAGRRVRSVFISA